MILSKTTAVSLGVALALAGGAADFALTSWRVTQLEGSQVEQGKRIAALESLAAVHTTELEVLKAQLGDIKSTLSEIHGQLSGSAMPARGRVP